MVQWQAPCELQGTFTQKKDAPSQRGEGARGLSGVGKSKAALGLGRLGAALLD